MICAWLMRCKGYCPWRCPSIIPSPRHYHYPFSGFGERTMRTLRLSPRRGKAYLIGAGPGRADLITVRGVTLLRRADVVIYDRLIARELLDEIRADAEEI